MKSKNEGGPGSLTQRTLGPGPGAYNQGAFFNTIRGAATFGRYNKGNDPKAELSKSFNGVPGPGQYNQNYRTITRNSPQSIFGTGNRDKNTFYDTTTKQFPGPGQYQRKEFTGVEGRM